MLKHVTFFNLAFLSIVLGFSQPTLTQPFHQPQIGDLYIREIADTAGIIPGASGASAVWNFSGLSYTGEIDTLYFETVDSIWASNFPSASMEARQVFGGFGFPEDFHSFYQTFPDSLLNHGWALDGVADGGPWFYLNPRKDMQYPFSYLDTFTDSISGEFWGFAVLPFSGTNVVTADAYGQLILPYATFNNVLRVHTQENTDGLFTPGIEIHKYEYYDYQTRFPLLTISWDGVGTKQVYARTAPPMTGISSISEIQPSVYLTPYTKELFVKMITAQQIEKIRVLDLQGKVMARQAYPSSTSSASLTLSTLSQGMYIVEIRSRDEIYRQRLLVKH